MAELNNLSEEAQSLARVPLFKRLEPQELEKLAEGRANALLVVDDQNSARHALLLLPAALRTSGRSSARPEASALQQDLRVRSYWRIWLRDRVVCLLRRQHQTIGRVRHRVERQHHLAIIRISQREGISWP